MKIEINIDDRIIEVLKKMFLGKKIYFWIICLLVVTSSLVYAAIGDLHIFNSGELISSKQVNENFALLKKQIAELQSCAVQAPVGTIIAFAGRATVDNLPAGWLLCDGRAVNRDTYVNLFSKIGVDWGVGDGINTFNLPDLRGVFLRGVNHNRNDKYADTDSRVDLSGLNRQAISDDMVGTFQMNALKIHEHRHGVVLNESSPVGMFKSFALSSRSDNFGGSSKNYVNYSGYTENVGDSTESRPNNAYVNYIIKY